ncbi:MAG: hypothetical protein PF444_01520, partial [Bacteroidales bacterium]|nr:hypothetical protein [Bacteroidales bacterium]
ALFSAVQIYKNILIFTCFLRQYLSEVEASLSRHHTRQLGCKHGQRQSKLTSGKKVVSRKLPFIRNASY